MKKIAMRFSTNISLNLGNDTRQSHSTMEDEYIVLVQYVRLFCLICCIFCYRMFGEIKLYIQELVCDLTNGAIILPFPIILERQQAIVCVYQMVTSPMTLSDHITKISRSRYFLQREISRKGYNRELQLQWQTNRNGYGYGQPIPVSLISS